MSYKQTKMWIVDKTVHTDEKTAQIKEAAMWITKGEVIAFPTETVYGLGGNALEEEAIEKIFLAKGRPSDNPLIVHVANGDQVKQLVKEIPESAKLLMEACWPGALTIILPNNGKVATKVTAGLATVALRVPDHPVALALLKEAKVPVAAPSANLSGKPSPTTATHVFDDLQGRIAGILDGGATGVGVESTVIDCTVTPPMILRPGGVTRETIEAIIGEVTMDPALNEQEQTPKSPGLKYTHYAPNAPLTIVRDSAKIQQLVNEKREAGLKVGVLTTIEGVDNYVADSILPCGKRTELQTVATALYSTLRTFDEKEVDVIFAESFPYEGVGLAIMNRLEKAAGGNVI